MLRASLVGLRLTEGIVLGHALPAPSCSKTDVETLLLARSLSHPRSGAETLRRAEPIRRAEAVQGGRPVPMALPPPASCQRLRAPHSSPQTFLILTLLFIFKQCIS